MSGVGRLSSSDPLFRRALLFSLAAHLATLAWVQAPVWDAMPPLSVIDARLEPLPEATVSLPKTPHMPLPVPTPTPKPVQMQLPTPLPVPPPVLPPPAIVVPTLVSSPAPNTVITPVVAVSSAPTPSVQPPSRSPAATVAMTAAQPRVQETPRVAPNSEWYPARKLDTLPKRLGKAVLVYPDSARRHGVTGSAKVRLRVNTLGEVEAVEVIAAQPEGVFDATVRDFFKSARYNPPQRDGRPVRAIIEERVSFTLNDDF